MLKEGERGGRDGERAKGMGEGRAGGGEVRLPFQRACQRRGTSCPCCSVPATNDD